MDFQMRSMDQQCHSTASGESLVTCLIKSVYMDYYQLTCSLVRKCYVFCSASVQLCVPPILSTFCMEYEYYDTNSTSLAFSCI